MDFEHGKEGHRRGCAENDFAGPVSRFGGAGDAVLGPFLGSAATGPVAIAAKRRFVGIEVDPEACEAARRLSEASGEACRI